MYDESSKTPLTDEQRGLVADNLKLIHWYLSRNPGYKTQFGAEDAFQIGCLGLMKAARNFDPQRAKFTTLAQLEIRNALAHHARIERAVRRRPPSGLVSLQAIVPTPEGTGWGASGVCLEEVIPDTAPGPEEQYEINARCAAARSVLDKNQLLADFFEGTMRQRELADAHGVSQSNISRKIKASLQKARIDILKHREVLQ